MVTAPSAKNETPPRPRVSLRAYAEHRGISPAAVRKALAGGRVTEAAAVKQPNGHWRIDVDAADAEWTENTDPIQQREKHRAANLSDEASLFEDAGPLPPSQLQPAPSTKAGVAAKNSLADMQREQLRWKTKTAQMEYERAAGDLLGRREVEREADHCARMTRDAMLRIPDRLSGLLTPEAREALDLEIRGALESVAGQLVADAESGEDPPSDLAVAQ